MRGIQFQLQDSDLFLDDYIPKNFTAFGAKQFQIFTNALIIQSDHFQIKAIHTPGHTPGSVCFFIPQLDALFTGDTLYPGPLRAQLPESNIIDYQKSIKKLGGFFAASLSIFPGHNATHATSDLFDEASKLFGELKHEISHQNTEINGKQLSIKL